MNLFITTALWGEKNRQLFADYSLPSLLAQGNIPALSNVTVHIITTPEDQNWLLTHPAVMALESTCPVEWDFFPHGPTDSQKYGFLTHLQNRSITAALDHDAMVFNYADFVWGEGSLPNAAKLLAPEIDAVLTFCLPVDEAKGVSRLENRRGPRLTIANRDLAALALDCLHEEATYRFWDAPEFTRFPSYLLFKAPAGVIVRAFHQTALVFRVKKNCELFRQGILNGTLDGDFTSDIAARGRVVHAQDSDQVMVCSLHDGVSRPDYHLKINPEIVVRDFVKHRASPQQCAFARAPIMVKVADADWPAAIAETQYLVGERLDKH